MAENPKMLNRAWNAYRLMVLRGMTEKEAEKLRQAFFSGAFALFKGMMITLDEGEEPTEKDMQRMLWLEEEMEAFKIEMVAPLFDKQMWN